MFRRRTSGVLYVATRQPHYVAAAFLSAHSVRDVAPDLPITLVTDLPELPFAQSPCFSNVVPIEPQPGSGNPAADGQLDRIRMLRESPYDRTLHLDADTRVLTPEIGSLFARLGRADAALTLCQPGVSRCARPDGAPTFDTGFMLYRKSSRMLALLAEWEARMRRNLELAALEEVPPVEGMPHATDPRQRRELLALAQTSLAQLVSPAAPRQGLAIEVMDGSWNHRAGPQPSSAGTVRIAHHPELRARLGDDVVARAEKYWRGARAELAMRLLNCVHDELVPPENQPGRAAVRRLIAQAFPVSPGALSAAEIRQLVGKDDPVILEVGANCGQTTVELLREMPGARIFAFEPDPRAIAKFRANVTHPGVTLYECAIGAKNGTVTFHQSAGAEHDPEYREGWDQSGSIRRPHNHVKVWPWVQFRKKIKVPIMTLDSWAARHGVRGADFIWADVQGAESDLVEGAAGVLANTRFFYTEYSNDEYYEGQITLPGLAEKLRDFELVRRYQMDVLFRRRTGR